MQKYGDALMAQAKKVPEESLWTQLLSMGGLTIQSESFLATFEAMDREFCIYHAHEPDQLSRKEGVVKEMTELSVHKLSVSEFVAKKLTPFTDIETYSWSFINVCCVLLLINTVCQGEVSGSEQFCPVNIP